MDSHKESVLAPSWNGKDVDFVMNSLGTLFKAMVSLDTRSYDED